MTFCIWKKNVLWYHSNFFFGCNFSIYSNLLLQSQGMQSNTKRGKKYWYIVGMYFKNRLHPYFLPTSFQFSWLFYCYVYRAWMCWSYKPLETCWNQIEKPDPLFPLAGILLKFLSFFSLSCLEMNYKPRDILSN